MEFYLNLLQDQLTMHPAVALLFNASRGGTAFQLTMHPAVALLFIASHGGTSFQLTMENYIFAFYLYQSSSSPPYLLTAKRRYRV